MRFLKHIKCPLFGPNWRDSSIDRSERGLGYMSTCRSCGAKIKWIKTTAGKNMPCDPELVTADDCDAGIVLVTEEGDVVKITSQTVLSGEGCHSVEGYVSHFATCPNADKFRRKGK